MKPHSNAPNDYPFLEVWHAHTNFTKLNFILLYPPFNADTIERYNKQTYHLQLVTACGSVVVTGLVVKSVDCVKGSVVSGRWVSVPRAIDMHGQKYKY